MVAALLMILIVVVAKIVTSRLLGFMEGQIANVKRDKREILKHVKVAESQRKVAEKNKQSLERKKRSFRAKEVG